MNTDTFIFVFLWFACFANVVATTLALLEYSSYKAARKRIEKLIKELDIND